jgi:hypothetical protein
LKESDIFDSSLLIENTEKSMKNLLTSLYCIVMGCCLLFGNSFAHADSGGSLPDSGSDAWQIVVSDIAGQVVALLPEDSGSRVLGISDIEGDDNTFAEALTAAINAATDFRLMERADLDKLLKEQGIQLSPLMDPDSLVEPGQIKGIEGLLIGRIVKKVQSPFYSSLQVFLKLDNVETGRVVFARTFEALYIPPMTWYLGCGFLALLFLLMLKRGSRKKHNTFLLGYSQKEAADRQAIEAELKKSRDNLDRTHDLLNKAKNTGGAMEIHQTRENLAKLLQKIQHGPVVHPENVDKALVKELDRQNKRMKGLMEKVRSSSERVLETAGKGGNVEAALNAMTTQLKDAANASYDRQAGTS